MRLIFLDKNFKIIMAVYLITALVFGGGLVVYADSWESGDYEGVNPNVFNLPTEITFEHYGWSYLNNRNHGSLLFYHRPVTSSSTTLPGANWQAQYVMTCYVRFRVPESGINVEAGVLDTDSQNVVRWIDIAGTKLPYEVNYVSCIPQPQYRTWNSFNFPNGLESQTTYVDNARQVGFVVYPDDVSVDDDIADVEYNTLRGIVVVYWRGLSFGPSLVNRVFDSIEAHPDWSGVGMGYLTMLGALNPIGEANTNAANIDDYVSHMSVVFPGQYPESVLEHISNAAEWQYAIINGTLDSWRAHQIMAEKEEVLSRLFGNADFVYPEINISDIDDIFVFLELDSFPDTMPGVVLTSIAANPFVTSLLAISLSTTVITIIMGVLKNG